MDAGVILTCPCSRCFMKSLSISALWINSLDLHAKHANTLWIQWRLLWAGLSGLASEIPPRADHFVKIPRLFNFGFHMWGGVSLFGLAIAGECDVSQLGGIQRAGFSRDGLSLGTLRLVQ